MKTIRKAYKLTFIFLLGAIFLLGCSSTGTNTTATSESITQENKKEDANTISRMNLSDKEENLIRLANGDLLTEYYSINLSDKPKKVNVFAVYFKKGKIKRTLNIHSIDDAKELGKQVIISCTMFNNNRLQVIIQDENGDYQMERIKLNATKGTELQDYEFLSDRQSDFEKQEIKDGEKIYLALYTNHALGSMKFSNAEFAEDPSFLKYIREGYLVYITFHF